MEKRDEIFDNFTHLYVRDKVRRAIGRYGIRRCDLRDLESHVYTSLFERLPKYDPDRAMKSTFTARIVDRAIVSYIRYRCAEKRDYRRESCSLNEPWQDVDGRAGQRSDAVDDRASKLHRGCDPRSNEDQSALGLDLETLMEMLTPELRELWQSRVDHSISELSERFDISQHEVKKRLAEIRRQCEDNDLHRYLRKSR